MLFEEIQGCSDVKALLIEAAQNNSIPHAMLFKGQAGGANLAIAVEFATFIHCTDRKENDACGVCPSCHKMARLAHPDFNIEVPVAKTDRIASDQIASTADFLPDVREFFLDNIYGDTNAWRQKIGAGKSQLRYFTNFPARLLDLVSLSPYEGDYKIVIIWLPEYMEAQASNGILKTLEEPPKNTLFFMVSVDMDEMMATILSRVQIVTVPSFTDNEVKQYLIDELEVPEAKATEIAFIADGNIQDAILLLDRDTFEYYPFFSRWMRNCYARNYIGLAKDAEEFESKNNREVQMSMLLYFCHMIRQALLFHSNAPELVKLPPEERAFIEKFSAYLNPANGEYIYEQLSKAYDNVQRNALTKLTFLDTSLFVSSAFAR